MTNNPVPLNTVSCALTRAVPSGYRCHNRVFTDGAVERRITVFTPAGAAALSPCPAVFAVDGNFLRPAVTSDVLARLARRRRPPVLVLMGYNTDEAETVIRLRAFDYTPKMGSPIDDLSPERRNGGADAFIDFLEETLLAYVKTLTPIDLHDLTLYGHSYGALLTLYRLSRGAGPFTRYVAADPSLWWKNGRLLTRLLQFCQSVSCAPAASLWLMQSGRHHRHRAPLTESQRRRMHCVSSARRQALFDALRAKPGLCTHLTELPDLTHGELLRTGFLLSLGSDPSAGNDGRARHA